MISFFEQHVFCWQNAMVRRADSRHTLPLSPAFCAGPSHFNAPGGSFVPLAAGFIQMRTGASSRCP
jgi:hypothetical protein